MRAALYARKSREDPRSESVARQLQHGRRAAEELGATIVDEYSDDGISGAEFARRPGISRLLTDAQSGGFELVIASEPERIGRKMLRGGLLLEELHEAGVRVYFYLTQEFASVDTPEGRLLTTIRGYSAENEREKARQRTRDALLGKARRGFVTGGAVYGYRNVPVFAATDSSGNPVRSHVEHAIDPEQAKALRGIFALRAEGYGLRAIARTLNGDPKFSTESTRYFAGVRVAPPRSGSWSPGCLRAILRNERYVGRIVWGKFRNTDKAGRTRIRERSADEAWERREAPHLRIIDDETWKRVRALDRDGEPQARRSGRGRGSSRTAGSLLSGLASCGVCNGPIRISGSWKRDRSYGCGYHNDRGATVCENRLLESERVVDRRLLEEIESILLVPEARDYAFEQTRRIVREQIAGSKGDIGSLRERLREIERELDQLVRAVEQGGPLKSLVERISRREEERAALERRCAELGQLSSVTELELRRVDRLIDEHVGALGEMLRGDARVAKTALRQILSGRVIFNPSVTQAGEPTYLLDATVDLGTCVPRADRMTVNVPDGI